MVKMETQIWGRKISNLGAADPINWEIDSSG